MSEDRKYSLSKQNIAEAYEDLFFREAMAMSAEEESAEIEAELLEMEPLSEEDIQRKKKEFEAILNRTVSVSETKTEQPKEKKKGKTFAFVFKKVISAAAMITFVAIVSLSTVVVASADAREIVAEYIYSFAYNEAGNHTEIRPVGDSTDEPEEEKIRGEWVATFVPEGYVLEGVEEFSSMKITEYKKGEEDSIYLNESGLTTVAHVDTENADYVEKIVIGESEALLVVKNGTTSIDWCTDDTFLSVIGGADKNDMIAFARGVRRSGEERTTKFVDQEVYSYKNSYAPTYMTDGYVLGNIYGESADDLTLEYSNGDKMIVFDQFADGIMQIDIEDAEIRENAEVGKHKALIVIKEDVVSVIWTIENKTIHVWGNAPEEVIVKVAASIEKVR